MYIYKLTVLLEYTNVVIVLLEYIDQIFIICSYVTGPAKINHVVTQIYNLYSVYTSKLPQTQNLMENHLKENITFRNI